MPKVAKKDTNLEENKKTKTTTANSKKTTTSKKKTTKTSTKKTTTTTKSAKSTNSKNTTKNTEKTKTTKQKKIEILEYYDLPNNYNITTVKILAQTPNTLFVYWDISNEDKENYIKKYGEFFFNDTKPVLIVHNETLNYSFEVDINDFANSWYLHVEDSNCKYKIELGRRPINNYAKINDYLYISESNNLQSPNDCILFDTLTDNVYFKNVKTNIVTKKDITVSFLTRIGKIYKAKDFYQKIYKNENINFDKLNMKNMPSS